MTRKQLNLDLENEDIKDKNQPLHVKYRPKGLSEIIGHKSIIKSLEAMLKSPTCNHTFLFTGNSGCGKTTLARIMAKEVGCSETNIIEVDAATNTGIEATKELISTLIYKGFGDQPNKAIIIDECHALSKAAWQALLKITEEPPSHVYFFLCTTEDNKVPKTIQTRSASYHLKPIDDKSMHAFLTNIVFKEDLKFTPSTIQAIVEASEGSPRQALVFLSKLLSCGDDKEAKLLLEQPLEDAQVIDLCRLLVNNKLDWQTLTDTLKLLEDTNAENIRIVIVNYLNSCLLNSKSDKQVPKLLDMLASFSKPCISTDKLGPILLAFGNYIFPVN